MINTYHKYVPNYLEKYKNNTIIPLLKNFDPKIVDYNIKDFSNHESYDKHFRYKIIKMREFIKAPRLEINANTMKMASHRKLNKK